MKEVWLLWSHQPETRWRDHRRTEIPKKALLIQLPPPQATSAQKTDQQDNKPSAANWLWPWEPPARGPGLTVPGQSPTASQWLLHLLISYPPENQRRFSLEQNLCMHKCIKTTETVLERLSPQFLPLSVGKSMGLQGAGEEGNLISFLTSYASVLTFFNEYAFFCNKIKQ